MGSGALGEFGIMTSSLAAWKSTCPCRASASRLAIGWTSSPQSRSTAGGRTRWRRRRRPWRTGRARWWSDWAKLLVLGSRVWEFESPKVYSFESSTYFVHFGYFLFVCLTVCLKEGLSLRGFDLFLNWMLFKIKWHNFSWYQIIFILFSLPLL